METVRKARGQFIVRGFLIRDLTLEECAIRAGQQKRDTLPPIPHKRKWERLERNETDKMILSMHNIGMYSGIQLIVRLSATTVVCSMALAALREGHWGITGFVGYLPLHGTSKN